MATFNEVGQAIMSERAYQDETWTDLDKENQPDDFITYIEKYVKQLREAPADQKQDFFRKVAALGVAAMEKFGAPQREGYEQRPCSECTLKIHQPLSDEQIDNMVADEQKAKVIERGVYYRVNEKIRIYTFPGKPVIQHEFDNIRAFAVMPSGGHRLLNNLGIWFYVQPGWHVLAVDGGIDGGVEVQ